MNRILLVTLIKKNIEELIMLTDGFMEMTEYPTAIINLAKNKTDDIRSYIDQLDNVKPEVATAEILTETKVEETPIVIDPIEVIETIQVKEELEEESVVIIESIEETSNELSEEEANNFSEDITEDLPIVSDEVVATVDTVTTRTETVEKKITFAEKMTGSGISRNEMHAKNENNGINATMANKKVDDIRQAISLGDRFRFQRELFRNNGEEMNKMLSYINMLASYDEVVSFLQSKYGWEEGHPVAEDFYQIIKRKF